MVNAILEGRKSQTRRIVKFSEDERDNDLNDIVFVKFKDGVAEFYVKGYEEPFFVKSPYQIGEKVFVKETFEEWDDGIVYKADNSQANIVSKWNPLTHMKRSQSRLTLLIKNITVERLQDISEEDAIKEGVQRCDDWTGCADDIDFRDAFMFTWNDIYKNDPIKSWEANPFVWKIEFEVVK